MLAQLKRVFEKKHDVKRRNRESDDMKRRKEEERPKVIDSMGGR